MNKKRLSLKYIILVPVIILGIVSVVSNIGSMNSLKRVNDTATKIVEENIHIAQIMEKYVEYRRIFII